MKIETIGRKILDFFGSIFVFFSIILVFKGGVAFIPVAIFFLLAGIALVIEAEG